MISVHAMLARHRGYLAPGEGPGPPRSQRIEFSPGCISPKGPAMGQENSMPLMSRSTAIGRNYPHFPGDLGVSADATGCPCDCLTMDWAHCSQGSDSWEN